METILHWVLYFTLGLIVFSILPVTKEIVRPILSGIGQLILWCFKESSEWVIFMIKELAQAHLGFFKHLITNREEYFPEEKIRQMSKDSRSKVNKPS